MGLVWFGDMRSADNHLMLAVPASSDELTESLVTKIRGESELQIACYFKVSLLFISNCECLSYKTKVCL